MRGWVVGALLCLYVGCVPFYTGVAYKTARDDERNAQNDRVRRERQAEKNRRIREEAPHCWEPIVQWRAETRTLERRQRLWDGLPDECKEQVQRQ